MQYNKKDVTHIKMTEKATKYIQSLELNGYSLNDFTAILQRQAHFADRKLPQQ